MSKYPIPTAYVDELKKHRYVQSATTWTVKFTPEFKQLAYDEYMNGKSMREIFVEAGLDVGILGTKRVQNLRDLVIRKAADNIGFEDTQADKNPLPTVKQLLKRLDERDRRIAYLSQENEFLKKIQTAEKACAEKAGKRS